MPNFKQEFIEFTIKHNILRFGKFKTKAGRLSPYFFNAGLFNDGDSLHKLGQFYAKAILDAQLTFDMLFGPAYKGIPLISTISIALSEIGNNYPFCFNRKEEKDHGEGGNFIGSPLLGKVLIIDDVISAGTSICEAIDLIQTAGAKPCGVVIALDRMERGNTGLSAIQEIQRMYDIQVISIINLNDLIDYLKDRNDMALNLSAVESYRSRYGVI